MLKIDQKKFALKTFLYLSLLYCFAYFCAFDFSGGGGNKLGFVGFRNSILGLSMLATFIASTCFLPQRLGNLILISLNSVSFCCFVIDLFCWLNFQIPLNSDMLFTAFETTLDESLSFFDLYLSLSTALWIAVFCFFTIIFWKIFYIKTPKGFVIFLVFAGFGCINLAIEVRAIFAPNYFYFSRQNLDFIEPLKFALKSVHIINTKTALKEEFQKQKNAMSGQSVKAKLKTNPIENIVLIVGESVQRGHMQVYGYSKANTPNFLALEKTPNLFVFSDVISSHAQTNSSISKMFTLSNYENQNQKTWYKQSNLFLYLKSVGYYTMWISNQESPISVSPASILGFLNDRYEMASQYRQVYDEKVLSYLDDYLKNTQKLNFITIHLSGSHASYLKHYPKSRELFPLPLYDEQQRKITAYDNTIFYNDFVVSEIFKRFTKQDSLVIYIPDHGEEIYEGGSFAGHIDALINRFMVEIPMLIYVSDLFIQKHPKLYEKIKSSIHRPYMSDDLIHTILDIAGIQTQDFDPTRSIINDKFNDKRKRIVGGSAGKDYDKELRGQKSRYEGYSRSFSDCQNSF